MSDINDQELERLLNAARDLLNKSRGYGPTTDEERQARSLVNRAKKFAMATRKSDLKIDWSNLNYKLKGVTVRKPKPNRGFQGVHDPRSYGSGGLADSHEPEGDDIQEDEWGGGFQSASDAHKEVQAGLKGDFQRERAQKLKLIVQVIRGEITKQKFKKLTGSNFDELMRNSSYYRNQIKGMSKKALAPVVPTTPTMKNSYESDGGEIQEKVDVDGRTRAYRDTVLRLEAARKFREEKTKAMQENRFGGLYDDGSGKGAFIPAPVDFNFHEAMRIVEKYRSLREKKRTLMGAPKEDMNTAVVMKGDKFSMSETELSPKQKEFRTFFKKALTKFGKSSPAKMDDTEKKKFFNWIEKNWKG